MKEQGNELRIYVHKLNLVGHSAVNATFQIEGLDRVMNFWCLVVFIPSDLLFAELSPKFDIYTNYFSWKNGPDFEKFLFQIPRFSYWDQVDFFFPTLYFLINEHPKRDVALNGN